MPKSVFIVGGSAFVAKMFTDRNFNQVFTPKEADILCFTGGADVSPDLYGQTCHETTWFDQHRDQAECYIFDTNEDKFKVGICRGGQFLNVLSGGSLYQDVDNHAIHGTHGARDTRTNKLLSVTSTHHQMMNPSEDGEVLLTARLTRRRETDLSIDKYPFSEPDTEAVWYKDTRSLCFQPHPEYPEGKGCRDYFFDLIEEFY